MKLYDGLSGIGLVDLDFHRRTGDLAFLERAGRAAAAVASAIESGAFIANAALSSATSSGGDRRGNAVENFRGGLLYGWSGLALFMLHMYELDGERRWLNAARQAIQRDIDQCKEMPDGTLQMRNGGRVLPYLATGSAGVAIVADRFLRHAADDRLADAVPALCRASATELCIGSGLFNGMAASSTPCAIWRPGWTGPTWDSSSTEPCRRSTCSAWRTSAASPSPVSRTCARPRIWRPGLREFCGCWPCWSAAPRRSCRF
ncbi:lanthionine synthetase C family protein [Actinomadura madurae]|uniref:lanthionine synthetase C family protein n=1 Tax=Actinomadura madurae TaxID=1993 RepID=UPI0020D25716|nr:lanthionine synthetase C family protein [Actinomadura madurae]MCQ0016404.1 lanthionine synthetase C family protein [Actinomadura madurae]